MVRRQASTLFVTGKGGAGKSFVTGELAREASARGLRVALVDSVDLDPRRALHRVLARLLRIGSFADRLMDNRTFSAVAAAAPGLADLVRVDYLRELAEGRVAGRFDLVIVNAPASGHGVAMLEAPRRVSELVARGPGAAVARAAREFTCDSRRFRATVVALPEELSVVETAEVHGELRRLGVNATATVVNGVYGALATEEQARWLLLAGVSDDARIYLSRRSRQLAFVAGIASPAGLPVVLPYLFDDQRLAQPDRHRLFESLVSETA